VEESCAALSASVRLLQNGVDPEAVADALLLVEDAGRLADAARVWAAAPLARNPVAAERLGFASPRAAVATLAQVSEHTARARLGVADSIMPDLSVPGAPLPPHHESVASAFTAGRLGLDSAVLITRELDKSAARVARETRDAVEAMLVNMGCGMDPTATEPIPPMSVDYLRGQVRALGEAIDPDGARPREERAAQKRRLWIGDEDEDGIFPIGGGLTANIAIPLKRLMVAEQRSPRFRASGDLDDLAGTQDNRTPAQRSHDTFAEIIMRAIAADDTPVLNGRTAAVLVTVSATDLNNPDGLDSDPIGAMSGSQFPVSRREVEQFIDAGGYRKVALNDEGAVVGVGSPERCFTAVQGMGIAARDGERCFVPGCTTPHTALQIHHVIPWREGGPTNTSDGILLCYWHHRRVDDGPWQYRMVNGLPYVRGPGIPEWSRPPGPLRWVA